MTKIPILNSIDVISKQYPTGEAPVLVMCSDMNLYICKYIRNSVSAQKLACELIGSKLATSWELNAPPVSFVNIKYEHWPKSFISPKVMTTMLGSKYLTSVDYVLPSTFDKLAKTSAMLKHLLKIALFDFWVANEDRNENNSNLLYDVITKTFVPIDFGCILNHADFKSSMIQLTTTDTIINSSLFKYLTKGNVSQTIQKHVTNLKGAYANYVRRCQMQIDDIVNNLPSDWNIPTSLVTNKLLQLFEPDWLEAVWRNFEECLNDNI